MNGEISQTNSSNVNDENSWVSNPLSVNEIIQKVEIVKNKYMSCISGIRMYNRSGKLVFIIGNTLEN